MQISSWLIEVLNLLPEGRKFAIVVPTMTSYYTLLVAHFKVHNLIIIITIYHKFQPNEY